MAQVVFNFNGNDTIIQCDKNDSMKEIFIKYSNKIENEINNLYFIYSGNKINDELTFEEIANEEDKKRYKMNIIVTESNIESTNSTNVLSENIICPDCKESAKIKFNDYKFCIYGCKNGHETNDISIKNFLKTQYLDLSKIICGKCGNNKGNSYDNIFYRCNSCKISICPLCKSNHDKSHHIINYDLKDYICDKHNENYNSYCKICKLNVCMYCEKEHNNHELIYFGKMIPNIEDYKIKMGELRNKLDEFKQNINEIINKLNNVNENFELYYKIYEYILNNYKFKKINYEILNNINEINNNNNVFNDLNKISSYKMINKFDSILDIFDKFNNEFAEISLAYKINNKKKEHGSDNSGIKIFSSSFLFKHKNICKIIYENNEYDLNEYFIPDNYKNKSYENETLEIKLRGIRNIKDINYMFYECSSLYSISDISKLNTSKITDISYMFYGCSSLQALPDISKWNISNVTNISSMFKGCSSLKQLPDISQWNTSNITNMSDLFNGCSSLKQLPDISQWNTSKINNISNIFNGCSSLQILPDITKWNISNITNIDYIFNECSSLQELPDISKWNISNFTKMSFIFNKCSSLKQLPDISKWNTSNITEMSYCKSQNKFPFKINLSSRQICFGGRKMN